MGADTVAAAGPAAATAAIAEANAITRIDRILLQVPFIPQVQRDMERAGTHTWDEVEVIRVETAAGIVGWGETIQNYTWGRTTATDPYLGDNPFELMWQDELGAGLQMALFDVAGKTAGVPIYRLLGRKVRDWCPISYWDHDMSPENYAAEAQRAVELGYTSMKIKTRPWWDVRETIQLMSEVTPDHFRIDCDWNATLNNAANAIPVLRELEETFPKIKIFEDPIPRDDAIGNRHLRSQIATPLAHHYEMLPPAVSLDGGGICDGWILSGGVRQIMGKGATATAVNRPFFLQMVGTGLTTTLSLHLSAVLKHAQWPTITCHELYQHSLLTERISVEGGHARVPEAAGLGVEVDEAALDKYSVKRAEHSLPKRLIKVCRPSGVNVYFTRPAQNWEFTWSGNQPVDEWRSRTEYLDDDGSPEFTSLHAEASNAPVFRRD